MRLKVQEYNCNWKRQQAQQSTCHKMLSVSEKKQKAKVTMEQNENGFKKSVKTLFTVGLNSPKKKEFMFDYFEKHRIKVESEEGT